MNILIVAFLVSIGFILFSIIKFKLHPFLALLMGSMLMGVLSGMPLMTILSRIANGFGGIMGEIGIIIFLGVILGQILHDSGCTKQIARKMLAWTGSKKAPLAVNMTGYIISIPVFFDVAFIILISLLKQLSKDGKVALNVLVTSLVVGLTVTHSMVIPTPGPLAVAGVLGANIGWFIIYGALVALPASLVAGVLYTKWLARHPVWVRDEELLNETATEVVEDVNQPDGLHGIFFILMPIILIILGNIGLALTSEGTTAYSVISFFGNTVIVLLFTVLVVFAALKKYITKTFDTLITESSASVGVILAIIGVGGAFGTVISGTGLGDHLVTLMRSWNMPVMFLGFLLAMCIHAGLGSITVSLVTATAVVGPIALQLGADPILCGLAICAGGMGMGLPSDSGFWTVSRFSKFTAQETFLVYTIPLTIASVTAMLVLTILNMFKEYLPGLI